MNIQETKIKLEKLIQTGKNEIVLATLVHVISETGTVIIPDGKCVIRDVTEHAFNLFFPHSKVYTLNPGISIDVPLNYISEIDEGKYIVTISLIKTVVLDYVKNGKSYFLET